jgi:hypothetical protein
MKRLQKLYKVYRCKWTKDGQVHRTEMYFAKDSIEKLDKTPPQVGHANPWFEEYKYKWHDFHHLRFLLSRLKSSIRSGIWKRRLNTSKTIIIFMTTVGMFVLSVLNRMDNKTIDRLEIEKAEIQAEKFDLDATIDSLTKEIEALKAPQIVVPSDSSTVTETVKEKKRNTNPNTR